MKCGGQNKEFNLHNGELGLQKRKQWFYLTCHFEKCQFSLGKFNIWYKILYDENLLGQNIKVSQWGKFSILEILVIIKENFTFFMYLYKL